jgi:predicted DNA-binding protein (MmcQ/YjbR family)
MLKTDKTMAIEWIRRLCKSLPHTTEEVLWGNDLVFKIGGKMYAVMPVDPAPLCLSFKVPEEEFAELCEREGVVPAPYSARYYWIALEREEAIPAGELKARVKHSYELVRAKLPKKAQAALGQ